MSRIIHVQSINEEEDEIKLSDKCFIFWGYKNPLLLLGIFICFVLFMAITITEYNKNN